jgi:hypothetical protein
MSYPSTSPLFFPRGANSSLSSTPANIPFFPSTFPMNLTVPCMLPGTSTRSPTSRSSPSPRDGVKGGIFPVVCESSSSTVLKPYPSLASGIAASEEEVSALRELFLGSAFGLAVCGDKWNDAPRFGLEAVLMPLFNEGRGRARALRGVLEDIWDRVQHNTECTPARPATVGGDAIRAITNTARAIDSVFDDGAL